MTKTDIMTPEMPTIRPLNLVKGDIKHLIAMIKERTRTTSGTISQQLEFICKELDELHALSMRDNMHDLRFLRDRRIRAISLKTLLNFGLSVGGVDNALYEKGMGLVMSILYENWSRQLLPKMHGVIHKGNLKQHDYLNTGNNGQFPLEPRSYVGISPEAYSDLDFPSFVVAETPPNYTQPLHNHTDTTEITFFSGNSECEFIDDKGQSQVIQVDAGDFMIFSPKTVHTIRNPSQDMVRNMSVKLPNALKDRGRTSTLGIGYARKVSMPQPSIAGVSEFDFTNIEGGGYISRLEIFDNRYSSRYLVTGRQSMAYVLDGEFTVTFSGDDHKEVASPGDAIIYNVSNRPFLDTINQGGLVYTISF